MDSKTDDFPELCVPKTAILGKLMYCCRPTSLSSSTMLISLRSYWKRRPPSSSPFFYADLFI
eukprot:CAMPEP_0202980144 /NCGR_PEP_ID=MMETSP1396-20130829/86109_1 /ASSEMBLY_ACC=CAM_ASM_000872 /TAXON_ID= /ORGANISM="Pseudokeronopsis sp., Strain Brazil" /LENGTH=61 /DNA_ID=CAMNT_0049719933 /DNA_START=1375 /DNA_END=1560 /DNA_ORIENTATION=+